MIHQKHILKDSFSVYIASILQDFPPFYMIKDFLELYSNINYIIA